MMRREPAQGGGRRAGSRLAWWVSTAWESLRAGFTLGTSGPLYAWQDRGPFPWFWPPDGHKGSGL